jgi:hypothetical protein
MYRSPRGYKRAKINNCRPKAVPPTAWDDVRVCDLVYRPYAVARKYLEKGYDRETSIKKLMKKFHMTHSDAHYIVEDVYPIYQFIDWLII